MHQMTGNTEPPSRSPRLQRLARWAKDHIAPEPAKPLRILPVPLDRESKDFAPAIVSVREWMFAFARSRHMLAEDSEDIAQELAGVVLAAAEGREHWITKPNSVATRGKTLVLERRSHTARRARSNVLHAAEIEKQLKAGGHRRKPDESTEAAELHRVIAGAIREMPNVVAATLWWLSDEPPRTFAEVAALFKMSEKKLRGIVAEARSQLVVVLTQAGLDHFLAVLDGPARAKRIPAADRPMLPAIPDFADPAAFVQSESLASGRTTS